MDLEDPAEQPSRLRRWSGEVAGGMRRLLPRFGADDESAPADAEHSVGSAGAEATAERVAPRDPAMARRMAQREAAPRREQRRAAAAAESNDDAAAPQDAAPWYQFWR